ncbi:hypothetical protein Kpho02_17020 [Kitasatospora phosalacinea]|uniref:TfuA-like core domain-containing protein n=1 Tax=Kitasatospora phosalacinea TaxID=2065 RepID=A0A9W6Q6G9_9ACTN|nr:TfuA-like protein [Kitasatospora phosalacinea]GLW69403.1 hypothetical protein Kpho02_17020 [Kitasatospora phosalacinea]
MTPELVLHVGPTGHGLDLPALFGPRVELRPPARRGDVAELVRTAPPGRLAIVDGTFHGHPAVGHAELRTALAAGWRVWGLASMGAIRAAELRHLGMRGHGEVYERYAGPGEFDDDEVTLLHGADAPYPPLSEPMVHLRGFLADLSARGLLGPAAADRVTAALKRRWYAERTLPELARALVGTGELSAARVERELAGFDRFRCKTRDLLDFAAARPWTDRD